MPAPMLVRDLVAAMERIAPAEYAEDWDKVGLHVGALAADLAGPVLLTIDLTEAVIAEAAQLGASAVISYHPPIFKDLRSITDATPRERIILTAARAGIAIYSPHTALDAAPGGVTDWLCEGLSGGGPGKIAGDCRALVPHEEGATLERVKIVTFLPEKNLETVRNALASAGAGRIGEYSVCSFSTAGVGTFLGGEGTKPAVGEPERLEVIGEQRLEMVCPRRALPIALQTLRRFHPYEEPAVDVYELAPLPRRRIGAGRRLVLDQPATMHELGARLRRFLGTARVALGACADPEKPVSTLAVVPGAGESLAPLAAHEGCEAFITGEMRHHNVLAAIHDGMHVLLAGHTNTERGYLPLLAERLQKELPGVRTRMSAVDRDPLVVL
ncbi:MAG TPA: Nif3-like dinuclear metal center hexameric protein [Phycisphaerales bacterium]|nr:Nif3-like dinuclear metal center hexameric protein [Phycisphaerales bacterium]